MSVQAQTPTQTHITDDGSQLIRAVLKANAAFSSISGLLFIFASGQVAGFLGIEDTSILGLFDGRKFILLLGFVILAFAGLVLFAAARRQINRLWAIEVAVADGLWVVISFVLVLTEALPFTAEGKWAVLIAADIVLAFALLEYWGIRRMR